MSDSLPATLEDPAPPSKPHHGGSPLSATPQKREKFLEALAMTGNVAEAARQAELSYVACYRQRWRDAEFAALWDEAVKIGTGHLEDEAFRRAHDGVDEPVFYQGEECGTIRRYSDTLLIFLLKARDPKYREQQQIALTGLGGGPIRTAALLGTIADGDAMRAYLEMLKQ